MKQYKAMGSQKRVTTSPKTDKSTSGVDSLYSYGNDGNTKGTRLPNHGCPKGAKKTGKRRSSY